MLLAALRCAAWEEAICKFQGHESRLTGIRYGTRDEGGSVGPKGREEDGGGGGGGIECKKKNHGMKSLHIREREREREREIHRNLQN